MEAMLAREYVVFIYRLYSLVYLQLTTKLSIPLVHFFLFQN